MGVEQWVTDTNAKRLTFLEVSFAHTLHDAIRKAPRSGRFMHYQ